MQPVQPKKPLDVLASVVISGVFMCLLVACGGRDVPTAWPEKSAASPAADAAPPLLVTRALDGPPPLPGENDAAWAGLRAPSAPGAHEHDGHGVAHEQRAGGEGAADSPSGHEPAGDAVRYVCPMHPDVVAKQPGTCPRCGMALVKRNASK